jgi:hypothetical protein
MDGRKGPAVKPVSALRNVLVRKSVSVGVTAIAVAGLLFTASPPASAQALGPWYVREAYSSYRISAVSLANYDPVVEQTSGRELDFVPTGPTGHYKLAFSATNDDRCVAAANNGSTVDIKPCSGANGVVWIAEQGPDGCSYIFENQQFSPKYLAGHDVNGDQFQVKDYGAAGWYYQFRLVEPGTGSVHCY